uniref:Uncharacterized protein LOC100180199 n=1 Tax=Phallusia mammillata TaxID=59560 RepID=A0A6F9DHP9_9ASCI|nr:uncharacterized protein LOC100180199 [Phallusia mammillata]
MKSSTILVMVDRLSRRPILYPEKFKTFVNNYPIIEHHWSGGPLKSIPLSVNVFSWQRRLTCLETDLNKHANNSVYLLLPLECLQVAFDEGFSTHLEMTKNMIKKCDLLIVNESKLSDMITVKMWPGESGYFNFILSVGDKHVAYVNMLFVSCP